jgi:hypothetical protein
LLLARLSDERRLKTLRVLTQAEGSLGIEATKSLAAQHDVPAQRECLQRLIHDLGAGKRGVHSRELAWMEGIDDEALLDELFIALVASYNHRSPAADFNDTMEPIHLAIRRIGGPAALAGYDRLLAEVPPPFEGVQFEVQFRDAIAQDMLAQAAAASLPIVLEDLGLPQIERIES